MNDYLLALRREYTVADLPMPTMEGVLPPLLLTVSKDSLDQNSTAAIRSALATRGALLIRGLPPVDARGAVQMADALFPGEVAIDTGEHPLAGDTAALYQPVPFASDQTLLWHHENSFNARFPRTLIFICRRPAAHGGATTLVDSRLVHQLVPEEVRARFAASAIRYLRRCDGFAGRSWQQLYRTHDPDVATLRAAENGETLTLEDNNALIVTTRPAFIETPHGPSWFNQLLHWHPSALPEELLALVRSGSVPAFRDCTYGDGEAIGDDIVECIVALHRQNEYLVNWQAGDVLLLDNTVFSHGRHPYRGPREHFVRMIKEGGHDETPLAPS
ncbi:TauD/TfdA family dioxygenase [Streptomyces griseorubiginosus]|uniref:TauD/TfdA family dioxygenase n=1 Tax=Streptomyces griseorubiginosus TaxID=67304 RepID=UPI0036EE079B